MIDEIEDNWKTFWKDIVTNKDGSINIQAVKNELFDYSNLMYSASIVYCEVTRNRVSKPNTTSGAVIAEYYDDINENYITKDDAKELIDGLKDELGL